MKKIITLDTEDDFVEVEDVNIVKNLIVCVHPEKGGVGALTTKEPGPYGDYMWRVTNGNGLFGGDHKTIREAVDYARTKGYEVRVLTEKDFD